MKNIQESESQELVSNGHADSTLSANINAKKRAPKSHEIIDRLEDKNPRSEEGKTPLHFAAKAGHLNVCKFIIERVQDKNPKQN